MVIISFRKATGDTMEPYETLWFRLLIVVTIILGFFLLVLGGGHDFLIQALKSLDLGLRDRLIQPMIFMLEGVIFVAISMISFAFIFSHPKISSRFGDSKKLREKSPKNQRTGK